ncbi:hypothetical protein [Aquimarina agarilytica]|uniref:hypothetical protein n=1 Tax=Aquimarina agarilytica TaxID=1087449 RepID=UPI0002894A87|nr:hypothetical protein [Aquimarina agarilytica]
MEQNERLKLLKKILLADTKEVTDSLIADVEKLSSTLNEPLELSQKVDPLIDKKIKKLIDDMPQKLSPVITSALKAEIKNSQDAVVEALFPIIGKMIKKYIANEIKLLNERINKQLKKAFSFKNFFRSKFGKKDIANEIIASSNEANVLQIFVIEKASGLLVAKYAKEEYDTMDDDLIAGMLTAIKSFVEDAFKLGGQNLETISYELYTLHIQSFHNYYVTAVVNGTYTNEFKDILEDKILDFAEKGISKEEINNSEVFSSRLKIYFSEQIV